MNTPETINIEKYAEALNNLVGMDIGYLGDSDENVCAIIEVIVAAKKLENKVRALTEENAKQIEDYQKRFVVCRDKAATFIEKNIELEAIAEHYRKQFENVKSDTIREMQSMIKEECIAGGIWPAFVARVVERVGEKLLGEKNDV